jgi:hypothetical protein
MISDRIPMLLKNSSYEGSAFGFDSSQLVTGSVIDNIFEIERELAKT